MKNIDFSIDKDDLKALFIHTRLAYGSTSFDDWVKECKKAYTLYVERKEDPKTFSQWVIGQILSLSSMGLY